MRQKALLSLSFVVILTQCTMTEQNATGEPLAKSVPFEMTAHGDTRVDEYYWMRDRENPEVIAYLNEENAYREKIMKATSTNGPIYGVYFGYGISLKPLR